MDKLTQREHGQGPKARIHATIQEAQGTETVEPVVQGLEMDEHQRTADSSTDHAAIQKDYGILATETHMQNSTSSEGGHGINIQSSRECKRVHMLMHEVQLHRKGEQQRKQMQKMQETKMRTTRKGAAPEKWGPQG